MKLIQYPLWIIYRVWFYVLVGLTIIVLLPLLFISVLKSSWYPFFFRLARVWSKCILLGMGFYWQTKWVQELEKGQSYIFVANHTSMTDIMLMFVVIKNHPFVFVGKKELARIPLFGFFYKRTCILVDRGDIKSRQAVFKRAQKRIESGLSICIFPEGGVPPESVVLDRFKLGAFRLAVDHQLPLVPLSFLDNKKRLSYTIFSGSPGRMRTIGHSFLHPKNYGKDAAKKMSSAVYDLLLNSLKGE
ncbi:1-acyl-sn-glycerol-3-phosphate acyltransferase [Flavobacteriaceae bacterium]|nr:1-acyl-sn-glycerol-3-phosphate acyltransferase [Flavobacteriaceae bacterium]